MTIEIGLGKFGPLTRAPAPLTTAAPYALPLQPRPRLPVLRHSLVSLCMGCV
jgi:hypothetical protein